MTLIELMVVVAVLGILAAIGIVMYNGAREKGYIAEAKQPLLRVVQEEENYRAEHGAYPPDGAHKDYLPFFGGNGTSGSGSASVQVGEYDVAFSVNTSTGFTIRATPSATGKMANNKKYGWMQIDQDMTKQYYDKSTSSIKPGWPYE